MDITSLILKGLLIFIILFLSFLIVWNINQNYFNKNQFLEGMDGAQPAESVASGNTLTPPNTTVSSSQPTESVSSGNASSGNASSSPPVSPPPISVPHAGPPAVSSIENPPLTNPMTTQLANNINTGLQTATDVVKLIDNNKLNDFYNAIKQKNLPNLGIQTPNTQNVGSNVTKYNF